MKNTFFAIVIGGTILMASSSDMYNYGTSYRDYTVNEQIIQIFNFRMTYFFN